MPVFDHKPKPPLEERVTRAAEGALEDQHSVSAMDVLMRMGLLPPSGITAWRQGRIPFLEDAIQGGREKIAKALEIFGKFASQRRLQPIDARYVRATLDGERELVFTHTKYAGLEQALRAQYIDPQLSERRKQNLEKKVSASSERVVVLILRDSECSECGVDLASGSFLTMEAGQPLCLACAGLGDLEFLPRGDTAVTRRATKYSPRRAVVVEFSRSRKRYERQGILVTEEAIRQAEEECAADAPERARHREQAALARTREDAALVEEMERKIRSMFPGCPAPEAAAIARHTAERGSGRVGRSAAGRKLDSDAMRAAVIAAIRHRHTRYDGLLAEGVARPEARTRVREEIEHILSSWTWAI